MVNLPNFEVKPVITDFAMILVSGVADYRYELLRLILFNGHLIIDLT
ncbi:MAG: hypothetical protein ACHQHN_19760 [Sphingobacteriales bacterium]